MSTRRNSNVENLLPLSDPEAILRSGNAERRRLAQLLTTSSSRPNPQQPIEMSDTTPTAGGPEHSAELTQTTEAADLTTAKDWFKQVLKLQHASVKQAKLTDELIYKHSKPLSRPTRPAPTNSRRS